MESTQIIGQDSNENFDQYASYGDGTAITPAFQQRSTFQQPTQQPIHPKYQQPIYNKNYSHDENLDYLVNDINNNFSEREEKIEPVIFNKGSNNYLNKIPYFLKEIILLLIIYFILSLTIVKDTIGKYLSYINKDESGNISYIGIIIYAILIAVIFVTVRYYLLPK
jgi:hypothetical protein